MVTVTLNLVGAGEVLLAGVGALFLIVAGSWVHAGYERRAWTEGVIATLTPADKTPEKLAKYRSARFGLRASLRVAFPFQALGWWIGGLRCDA